MPDAVVVGSGPNGLVGANVLADHGWTVVVLEAQDEPGGAVRTDSAVQPGFRHDTFSAFYPLAVASPAFRSLGLERYGLEWMRAPAVLGNPLPDSGWALLHRDPERTAAGLDTCHRGDGAAWLRLCQKWEGFGPDLVGAALSPFPPVRSSTRAATGLLRHLGPAGLTLPLQSVRRLAGSTFGGEAARLLLAGNALHADFSPHDLGSGTFGLILAMLGQTVGYPVPRGGAAALTQALVRRLESRGGSVVTRSEVAGVVIRAGRCVGVRLADGSDVRADRAVLAAVSAPMLYGSLVDTDDLPAHVRRGMRRFRWDPATVKVDWALSGPVPWQPPPSLSPGTVHLADSVDDLAAYTDELRMGAVPARPLVVMGQMTTCDPGRSPGGTESAWAYCHVPQVVRSDAGGACIRGVWDHDDRERLADRVQDRVEQYAPGFAARILARRVLGPRELEAADANLRGGAINGGTARLRQQVVLRPIPGRAGARTGIRGLYLASASAHPGGGVHGACGRNAALSALRDHSVT